MSCPHTACVLHIQRCMLLLLIIPSDAKLLSSQTNFVGVCFFFFLGCRLQRMNHLFCARLFLTLLEKKGP